MKSWRIYYFVVCVFAATVCQAQVLQLDGLPLMLAEKWTPAELTTLAWFDASKTSSVEHVAGSVTNWNDLSGNGYDALQSSAALQPTTGSETINGLNAIVFAGDYLVADIPEYTGTDVAVFAVYKRDSYEQNQSIVTLVRPPLGDYQSVKNAIMVTDRDDGNMYGFRLDWLSYVATPALDVVYQAGSIFDSVNHTMYLNGTNGTPVASSGNFGFDEIVINARYFATIYRSIGFHTVGEIIVITGGVSEADRQNIEGYLAHKWGINSSLQADHPYKIYAPVVTTTPALVQILTQ
jgi:hypothetical protein